MADSHEFSETHVPVSRPREVGNETLDHLPIGGRTPESHSAVSVSAPTEPMTGSHLAATPMNASETIPPAPADVLNPPTGPDFSSANGHIPTGKVISEILGFDILAEVGRGGMGVVYQARQLDLNRLVAIKMVIAERFDRPEELVRFRLEAEMLARVRHPNVVQV